MIKLIFFVLFISPARLFCQQHIYAKLESVKIEQQTPCLTKEEQQQLNATIAEAKKRKKIRDSIKLQAGKPVAQRTASHPLFIWPMKKSASYDMAYKYFVKGNFVDQDTITSITDDYSCGNRTYNNHDASDIGLFPFPWRMMDNMYVYAVAAAPGEIIFKESTGYDRNCEVAGSPTSNIIVLQHADNSISRYHHFKQNSLTSKQVGDMVEAGEFLGYIGSSGRSSGPHLHFAVYDANNNNIEPYYISGVPNCNILNQESWWQNQPDYWDPKINRVMTHSTVPVHGCWDEETVYPKNNFMPGDSLFTGIAISESDISHPVSSIIYRPDGSSFAGWTFNPAGNDNQQYRTDGFILPSNAPTGTWQVRVSYRGNFYYHHFSVNCPVNLTPSGTVTGTKAYISGNTISSTVIHNVGSSDKVLYQAQDYIEFKPGFHAKAGGLVRTRLAGCNYTE